jgi:hypothetical protein
MDVSVVPEMVDPHCTEGRGLFCALVILRIVSIWSNG